MGATLAAIWRHPVKSLGREALAAVRLTPGEGLPFDRTWAVAHGASRFAFDAPAWADCANFARVTLSHRLMQVEAAWDEGARRLTLSRPDAAPLTADPDAPEGAAALAGWAQAAAGDAQPGPFRLVRAPQPMTDTDYPSVSVASLASLRALSQRMGVALDPRRFRANLWIEGLAPWEERDWLERDGFERDRPGREIAVGGARLRLVEPIGRCAATEVEPATGRRDAPVVRALREALGEADFGVYATVVTGADVRVGDAVG